MNKIIAELRACPKSLACTYALLYFVAGNVMNEFGKFAQIAQFKYHWQVFTVYVVYLAPISIACRRSPAWLQYLFGLAALAPIELVGYRLGSSIAFDGNVIDRLLGPRNFTLAMTVFFGVYIPLGNWAANTIHRMRTANS